MSLRATALALSLVVSMVSTAYRASGQQPDPSADKPDLTATFLEYLPADPHADQRILISWRVGNDGAQYNTPVWCSVYVDGARLRCGRCVAGAHRGGVLEALGPGRHSIAFVVDDPALSDVPDNQSCYDSPLADPDGINATGNGTVDESDESNNAAHVSIDVRESNRPPDLIVSLLRIEPAGPSSTDRVRIEFTPRNTGGTRAGEFSCYLSVDGIPEPETSCREGQPVSWLTGPFEPGEHRIEAHVDFGRAVLEIDEGNNEGVRRFLVRRSQARAPRRRSRS